MVLWVPNNPASDSPYKAYLRIQLLTCWLSFSRVGLSQYAITHWVTITNFLPSWRESKGLGFTLERGAPCYALIVAKGNLLFGNSP